MKPALSPARLHELFDLHEDGELVWKDAANPYFNGKSASHLDGKGRNRVRIGGKHHACARVVFAMTHGRWPEGDIDHINRVKTDDRPSNLREASRSDNCYNKAIAAANTSGACGVSWYAARDKWITYAKKDRRKIHLGYFDRFQDAFEARLIWDIENVWPFLAQRQVK